MPHIQLTFHAIEAATSEVLVALLSHIGYPSFQEEENCLHAFIDETDYDEALLQSTVQPFALQYTTQIIEDKNWNAEWESNYSPIIVNDKVAIRAHFHAPIESVEKNIVITPKMSFGTGHHATTQMIMAWLSGMQLSQKNIFDYGCGTGVLGIYASMQGASNVVGVDIESWCVENSIENAAQNNVAMQVLHGDIDLVAAQKFDVVLANINLHILQKQMMAMMNSLLPNGEILMSGFYESDAAVLEMLAQQHGLIVKDKAVLQQWCALWLVSKE